ncbi:MAG: rane protein [Paenibacillus sp.]|jgi:uncharacterized membrane-anchored protein YitT (DUF2179 family)|nr:rane protein [Paenibacillus sp.]
MRGAINFGKSLFQLRKHHGIPANSMNLPGGRTAAQGPFRIGPLAIVSFCIGAILIAVGLELFLKPNRIVAGGTQGISILLSHMTEMRMGLFLFFINVPFLFLAAPRGGWRSSVVRLAALAATAAVSLLLHPIPPITEHSLAASLLGGLSLGFGAGLILRTGSYTDGVNEVAQLVKRKVSLSIAELVMLVNLSILTLAGFQFGWGQAMYSVVAYFVAYQSLRYTMRGRHRYTMVRICGGRSEALREQLQTLLGPDMAFVVTGEQQDETMIIIARQEEKQVRRLLREIVPAAVCTMIPLESAQYGEYKYWQ